MVPIIAFARWQMYGTFCGFFRARHICNSFGILDRKGVADVEKRGNPMWFSTNRWESSVRLRGLTDPQASLLGTRRQFLMIAARSDAIRSRLCLFSTRGRSSPPVWLTCHDAWGSSLHEEDRFRYSCGACSPEHRGLRSNWQGQGPSAGCYKGVSCTAYVWGKGRPRAGPFLFGAPNELVRPLTTPSCRNDTRPTARQLRACPKKACPRTRSGGGNRFSEKVMLHRWCRARINSI